MISRGVVVFVFQFGAGIVYFKKLFINGPSD